jgi:hypothetical protein
LPEEGVLSKQAADVDWVIISNKPIPEKEEDIKHELIGLTIAYRGN